MDVGELIAELRKQPGTDLETKLVALLDHWRQDEEAPLQARIEELKAKNDALERIVNELRGRVSQVDPQPVGETYSMEQFMLRLASKLGRTYGWRTDYAVASQTTPDCQPVHTDEIHRWQKEGRVPTWAYHQIDVLVFKPRMGRSSPEWTAEQVEFLITEYNANPSQSNAALASRCTEQFGRAITPDAIKGAIYRLAKQGRLPQHRPANRRS